MHDISAAASLVLLAVATERAAGEEQRTADGIRPRAFAKAEDREPWNRAEDLARGMWERRNRVATRAASEFIRQARLNGAT